MNTAHETLRQLIEGKDFDRPGKLLATVRPKAAANILPGFPYSIATNVAHADIWQKVWLGQIVGQPHGNPFPDFPFVPAEEWSAVRSSFLANLERALALAADCDPGNEKLQAKFIQIAIHTSYHLGQVKLLKRVLRSRSLIPA